MLCDVMEDFTEIARATQIPLATGKAVFKMGFQTPCWSFTALILSSRIYPMRAGITEVKKIAGMAEAYDVALAPHCPLGPIALASVPASGCNVPQCGNTGAEHRDPLQ